MKQLAFGEMCSLILLVVIALLADTGLACAAEKPNVILLMSDDQGWGDVGFNGNEKLDTPHLDAMAAAGIRFDRFYASAPLCSPTRGSCLTVQLRQQAGRTMERRSPLCADGIEVTANMAGDDSRIIMDRERLSCVRQLCGGET